MLEDKIKEISESTAIADALSKLIGVNHPLVLLQISDEDADQTGKLWIRSGEEVAAAKSEPANTDGYLALLQMLAFKHPKFELASEAGATQGEEISIKLEDLVNDQEAVIQQVKSQLWPVSEEQADAPAVVREEFELIVDRDDLAEKRRKDLEVALEFPEEDYAPSRSAPVEEYAAPTVEETPPIEPVPEPEVVSPAPVAVPLDPPAYYEVPPPHPTARETVQKLRTLSSLEKEAPKKPVIETAPIITAGNSNQIRTACFVTAAAAAIILPGAFIGTFQNSLTQQRLGEDMHSVSSQLHSVMRTDDAGEGTSKSGDRFVPRLLGISFRLPDMHSPFRPPEIPQAIDAPPSASGAASQFAELEDETAEDNADLQFNPPKQLPPALSADQLAEIEAQMAAAERLVEGGSVAEAAALLHAEHVKFPQHAKLRVALISAYVKLGDHARAKTLAMEGLKQASKYEDYLVFFNLVKQVKASK